MCLERAIRGNDLGQAIKPKRLPCRNLEHLPDSAPALPGWRTPDFTRRKLFDAQICGIGPTTAIVIRKSDAPPAVIDVGAAADRICIAGADNHDKAL